MSYNIVAIPTRSEWESLRNLIGQLLADEAVDEVFIFDNSPNSEAEKEIGEIVTANLRRMRIVAAPSLKIYEMWNAAIKVAEILQATLDGQVTLSLLNDDIILSEKFVSSLAAGMRESGASLVYPDWTKFGHTQPPPTEVSWRETTGTGKDSGMSGWAFMLRADAATPVDLQFEWWCGDDDIERTMRANGGSVACVKGVGLTHLVSRTAQKHPELHAIGWADVERFKKKWGSW